MNISQRSFKLHEALEPLRHRVQAPYPELEKLSLGELRQKMPPLQFDDVGTGYVEFLPSDSQMSKSNEYEPSEAIIVPNELGVPYSPQLALRMFWLQEALPKPVRVVCFPNSTMRVPKGLSRREHKPQASRFRKGELEQLAQGRLDPIAQRQLRVLEQLGIKSAHFVASSQAASVAAACMRVTSKAKDSGITIKNSLLVEPPGMEDHDRTTKELERALLETFKSMDFFRAMGHTGIDLFLRLNQARYPRDVIGQYVGAMLGSYIDRIFVPELRPIAQGLGKSMFVKDMEAFFLHNNTARITVIRGGNSAITTMRALVSAKRRLSSVAPGQFEAGSVDPFYHSISHSIPLMVGLSLLALEGRDLPEGIRLSDTSHSPLAA